MMFFTLFCILISTVSCKMTMVTPGYFSDLPTDPTTPTTKLTTKTTTAITTTPASVTTKTTTAPPTTTIPTTPKPAPSSKIYYVNDTTGICLLFSANIKINIGNIHQENTTKSFEVDKVDSFNGTCSLDHERLTVYFWKDWTLELRVQKVDNVSYDLSLVTLKYNTQTTPTTLPFSHTGTAELKNLTEYSNNLGQEYVCRSGLHLNDSLSQWNYTLNVWLDDFKMEAFRGNTTTIEFNANGAKSCEADTLYNDLIPIIVGGVLIVMILIVLVAYLISRKSRRSGYESV